MLRTKACCSLSVPVNPKGVQVKALCRTLDFFHSSLSEPSLHVACFFYRGLVTLGQVTFIVKGNCKHASYKGILYNCVLPTPWFVEEPHISMVVIHVVYEIAGSGARKNHPRVSVECTVYFCCS